MKKSTRRLVKKTAVGIGQEILIMLSELGEMAPGFLEGKHQYAQRLRRFQRGQITDSFRYLSKKGLVQKIKYKKSWSYKLSNEGRAKSARLLYLKEPRKRKRNGLASIVIFDINEENRAARKFLRKSLHQNGFTLIQKSVFMGPWEINKKFKALIKELKIEKSVMVLEGRILFK